MFTAGLTTIQILLSVLEIVDKIKQILVLGLVKLKYY